MDAAGTLAEVLKGEGPRVLATLARTIGDLTVAEDALTPPPPCAMTFLRPVAGRPRAFHDVLRLAAGPVSGHRRIPVIPVSYAHDGPGPINRLSGPTITGSR